MRRIDLDTPPLMEQHLEEYRDIHLIRGHHDFFTFQVNVNVVRQLLQLRGLTM